MNKAATKQPSAEIIGQDVSGYENMKIPHGVLKPKGIERTTIRLSKPGMAITGMSRKISVQIEADMEPFSKTNPASAQDRGALAKMVMNLFDHWNLSTEDQACLLGLATSNRAALTRYRKGVPVGTSRDQYERVGHFLAIHRNLRALFPENRELVYKWMSLRNRAFDNHTPVEVIRERGFAGLLIVRSYLDRALLS